MVGKLGLAVALHRLVDLQCSEHQVLLLKFEIMVGEVSVYDRLWLQFNIVQLWKVFVVVSQSPFQDSGMSGTDLILLVDSGARGTCCTQSSAPWCSALTKICWPHSTSALFGNVWNCGDGFGGSSLEGINSIWGQLYHILRPFVFVHVKLGRSYLFKKEDQTRCVWLWFNFLRFLVNVATVQHSRCWSMQYIAVLCTC